MSKFRAHIEESLIPLLKKLEEVQQGNLKSAMKEDPFYRGLLTGEISAYQLVIAELESITKKCDFITDKVSGVA